MEKREDQLNFNNGADIRAIGEKLETLPREQLMYVAGAVAALVASAQQMK